MPRNLKVFWVSLDTYSNYVKIWSKKPRTNYDGTFIHASSWDKGPVTKECAKDFRRVTGIKIKEGECFKVRMAVTR